MELDDLDHKKTYIYGADTTFRDGVYFSFEENRAASLNWKPDQEPRWDSDQDILLPIFHSPVISKKVAANPPSPTIHTKEAMADIFQMFSTPLEQSREILYNPEDDETITKRVYKRPVEKFKIGVYRDEEQQCTSHVDSAPLDIFKDEDTIGITPMFKRTNNNADVFGHPVHIMTPVTERTELTMTSEYMTYTRIDAIQEEEELIMEKIKLEYPCDPASLRFRVLQRQKVQKKRDDKLFLDLNQKRHIADDLLNQKLVKLPGGKRIKWLQTLSNNESNSQVFLVQEVSSRTVSVVKIQNPPTVWEYYILLQLWNRTILNQSFLLEPISCSMYQNESIIEMNHQPFPSLYHVVCQTESILASLDLDEILVAYWTWEILRIVQIIHKSNILHGDINIHNFHLRKSHCLSDRFDPTDEGWKQNGLTLLDWGAAIDLNAFEDDQRFQIAASHDPTTIAVECVEFRNGGSWRYEPDFYGVACVLYILVFGTVLETNEGKAKKPNLSIAHSIKDTWHPTVWKELFDVLLNTTDHARLEELRMELQELLVIWSTNSRLTTLLSMLI
jgi:hypothetical protein